MPRQTTVEIPVPDASGPFVGFSAYARILENAATTASTEAGFAPDWYAREGTIWVIRRSTIERTADIAPGTLLSLRTWVADFRRVRSRREYEGRVAGEVVLRGHTDWVYVERAAGKPRRIPETMMQGFLPDGGGEALPRAALVIGDPPAEARSVEWTVETGDLDLLEHVNNAKYFDYVESVATSVVAADFRPQAHDVEYVDEARVGQRLRGTAWVVEASSSPMRIATEIRRADDGATLPRASSVWSC